jgi:photosystem II stability/assembly factor-like uncharacterized protein
MTMQSSVETTRRRFGVLLGLLLASFASGVTACATCPFDIPVVTLPPHQVGGFSWGSVVRPQGDACVGSIAVEPTSALAWYVGGENGLYMTKNGGQSWTKPLTGQVGALLLVPGSPQLVYVGVGNKLYLSRDHGQNWNVIRTYKQYVGSLLVADGQLYVGLRWNDHVNPSGVVVSNLGGGGFQLNAFGPGQTGLIVWTLARDPQSGMLYAGTEIFDHPKPYHPPFFRSSDDGKTWTNVAGTLPWHVIASAVRPNDGFLYALTEGAGLFGSPNQGTMWQPPANPTGPTISLLMDPNHPTRLIGGRQKYGLVTGGIFESKDAGQTFQPIGLDGVVVSGLAVDGTASQLFAAAYASGIYVSPLPPP